MGSSRQQGATCVWLGTGTNFTVEYTYGIDLHTETLGSVDKITDPRRLLINKLLNANSKKLPP